MSPFPLRGDLRVEGALPINTVIKAIKAIDAMLELFPFAAQPNGDVVSKWGRIEVTL